MKFARVHLKNVSRSFAFCIERLPEPFRTQVAYGYLLCRILDTIEDSAWSDSSQQILKFQEFDAALEGKSVLPVNWSENFPHDIPEGERLLLRDAHEVLARFYTFSDEVQVIMREVVVSMSHGMLRFVRQKRDGVFRLHSLLEVNKYCFFVAGVVGEMLTRLFVKMQSAAVEMKSNTVLLDSFHFGLFLQKVNLLKDQGRDEREGRFFVPARDEVRASLRGHAEAAFEYLLRIPKEQSGYRLFCAWSLLLGLASMPFIDRSWKERMEYKIPRLKTVQLLAEVERVISDNEKLRKIFDRLSARAQLTAGANSETALEFNRKNLQDQEAIAAGGDSAISTTRGAGESASVGASSWAIRECYSGVLDDSGLAQLGVLG